MSEATDLRDRAALMRQGHAVFCPEVLDAAADRIEALEAQAVPPGYIKIPTSRDEAAKMILLAQNYLEFNK